LIKHFAVPNLIGKTAVRKIRATLFEISNRLGKSAVHFDKFRDANWSGTAALRPFYNWNFVGDI